MEQRCDFVSTDYFNNIKVIRVNCVLWHFKRCLVPPSMVYTINSKLRNAFIHCKETREPHRRYCVFMFSCWESDRNKLQSINNNIFFFVLFAGCLLKFNPQPVFLEDSTERSHCALGHRILHHFFLFFASFILLLENFIISNHGCKKNSIRCIWCEEFQLGNWNDLSVCRFCFRKQLIQQFLWCNDWLIHLSVHSPTKMFRFWHLKGEYLSHFFMFWSYFIAI